jgi:5-methyltetrahydrofolate--homocysteine methyltransferase
MRVRQEDRPGFHWRRRGNALKLDWSGSYQPPKPSFVGTKVLGDYPIAELIDYIDWTPFFSTWELPGKFPAILDDAKFGPVARSVRSARAMLDKIVADIGSRQAPCSASGRPMLTATIFLSMAPKRAMSRSQCCTRCPAGVKREGRANSALSDFIAPRDSGLADYVGGFAVTAGIGEEE